MSVSEGQPKITLLHPCKSMNLASKRDIQGVVFFLSLGQIFYCGVLAHFQEKCKTFELGLNSIDIMTQVASPTLFTKAEYLGHRHISPTC